jgi:methanethiol S-methyltransferase
MIWIVLAISFWGIFHSALASQKAKDFFHQLLGEKTERFYRLAYNIFASVSFLPVLALVILIPDRILYRVSIPWLFLFVAGELLGVLAMGVGMRQTDSRGFLGFRQPDRSNKPSHLTINGLYRYVRHPIYSAGLVIIWLLPIMSVNTLAFNLTLTVYIIIGAHLEERRLQHRFGKEYADYKAITPMFIPFLKRNHSRLPSSL